MSNRRGVYGLVNKMDLVKGRIVGNKDGFGFVVPEDDSGDLYLAPRQMQKVFDGEAAKRSDAIRSALDYTVDSARVFKTDYRADGTVVVHLAADPRDFWFNLRR